MANDHSYPHESAEGKCDECGAIVHFEENSSTTQCPVCMQTQTRMSAGAASATMQRHGYYPGQGVVPRRPRF